MAFLDLLKAIVFGIVEGVTEWLPISSTGHMILLERIMPLNVSARFLEMFLVVIQLGAILAVVLLYWHRLWPFARSERSGRIIPKRRTLNLWCKILVACVPAAVVGVLWDDVFNKLFYNYVCVAIALIVFGILFIVIERRNEDLRPTINHISEITFETAAIIGLFQLIAAIFPGTSRSGATIIGALLIGVSRKTATEFTFFLAVPVMIGASLLKIVKLGGGFSGMEIMTLIVGMVVAFIVSVISIRFLVGYIKKHDFKVFGWYRIALGAVVLCFAAFVH